jgi:hypothetical protein
VTVAPSSDAKPSTMVNTSAAAAAAATAAGETLGATCACTNTAVGIPCFGTRHLHVLQPKQSP